METTRAGLESSNTLRVLVVCTANICRSPVGERLLERELVGAGHNLSVRSAGVRAMARSPQADTVDAGLRFGVDISDHRPRTVTRELINADGTDLVLALTREHLRHVVGLEPDAWPRTFTLKEFARRASFQPALETSTWYDWVAALSVGRRTSDYMQPDAADDVIDPFGKPAPLHLAMVNELAVLVAAIGQAAPKPACVDS